MFHARIVSSRVQQLSRLHNVAISRNLSSNFASSSSSNNNGGGIKKTPTNTLLLVSYRSLLPSSVRHFSVTCLKYQDLQTTPAAAAVTQVPEEAVSSKEINSENQDDAIVEQSSTIQEIDLTLPTAETSTTQAAADFLPEKPVPQTEAAPSSQEIQIDFLPEKPVPVGDAGSSIHYVGDPPFDTLGLAGWSPSGRFQYLMEQLHVSLGVEWWGVIMIMTALVRTVIFPVVIVAQKNAANQANHMPQFARYQEQLTEARQRGDHYDAQRISIKMQKFMREKDINPIKMFAPIAFQFPVFMSMFFGLRGMANLPVESMANGGLFHFTNLTVADPYYILPLLTSTTLFLQMKLGADGMDVNAASGMPLVKKFMLFMPVPLFFLTMKFPAALCFYWFCTNLISVGQAKILRIDGIRDFFKIPKIDVAKTKHLLPEKKKGLTETVKESWDNYKVTSDIAARKRHDEKVFTDAKMGKPIRTYKFDPTKPPSIGMKKSSKK